MDFVNKTRLETLKLKEGGKVAHCGEMFVVGLAFEILKEGSPIRSYTYKVSNCTNVSIDEASKKFLVQCLVVYHDFVTSSLIR